MLSKTNEMESLRELHRINNLSAFNVKNYISKKANQYGTRYYFYDESSLWIPKDWHGVRKCFQNDYCAVESIKHRNYE